MNKVALAAVKAITKMRGDITEDYRAQRVAEEVSGLLTIADPRCRIDEAVATARDGYAIPLKVFTPLDIGFSLKSGLHVSEDTRARSCSSTAEAGPTAPSTSTPTPACAWP